MKKLLVLGGAEKSVPLVCYAKEKGHQVVLCDREPDNPCRAIASVFVQVSTIDLEGVMRVARDYAVDGVVSFGSDLMAGTAAYVGQALGLPSNPYEAVVTMGRKDLFRAFLRTHGFATPEAAAFATVKDVLFHRDCFRLPVMVKPVDSAGSTGVYKVTDWSELPLAFELAACASRTQRVIVEEFIQMDHDHMIAGDAFVLDGQVVFWGLLNSHRGSQDSPFIPTGTSFPIALGEEQQRTVHSTVQALIDALGIRLGGLNLELMYDERGALYIIEIAARNGGNYIPELLEMATGVNLVGALVDASLGEPVHIESRKQNICVATYMIHSQRAGIFQDVILAEDIKGNVSRIILNIQRGDTLRAFDRAIHAIGVLFLQFGSMEEQQAKLKNMSDYVTVNVR